MNRRQFISTSAMAFVGLQKLLARDVASSVISPYGPLLPDPKNLLDLPKGFTYQVLSGQGDRMDDGFRVPGYPDGMAAFDGPDGRVILIRNHELSHGDSERSPFVGLKELPEDFDASLAHHSIGEPAMPAPGGTTSIVYDPKSGTVEKQWLSLAGTDKNCAGGHMPWGAWITCEETVDPAKSKFKDHGYCFEVRATTDGKLQKAVPLKAMGRFRHEAVALDPVTRAVYLTEDRNDGLIYKFIPDMADDLSSGKLQALAFVETVPDTRNYEKGSTPFPVGKDYAIKWIDLEDVDSPKDDLRHRGNAAGASYFARGEGIVWREDSLYICCTDGGNERQGQIFKLTPGRDGAADRISLFLQPQASDLLTNGDNICNGPHGHMVICEDLVMEHREKRPHVRGITADGKIYTIARNARNASEFAGSCWHEASQTLFVNMQGMGKTLAIRGPWAPA